MAITIVLFRDDLRLHDHPALWSATQRGKVVPVYIAPKLEGNQTAEHVWRHYALQSLANVLHKKGCRLIVRQGLLLEQLLQLAKETQCDAVYWHERFDVHDRQLDYTVASTLLAQGIDVRSFEGTLLLPPNTIVNGKKMIYQVFTPFWKRYQSESIPTCYPEPEQIESIDDISSDTIASLGLLPQQSWYQSMLQQWKIGEKAAIQQWLTFREKNIYNYSQDRDYPAKENISFLSPHLACGSISARALWASAQSMMQTEQQESRRLEIESFLRQLVWREFSYYQLYHQPTIVTEPLRKEFLTFPWLNDEVDFTAWQRGQTGYPLVDAGMRELWATGFMHNRVRMVTASFLVKHLLIHWTKGYDWFRQTLVDFNKANNALGWQWVAGTGVDAAPYFRIFNPILQSEKFDPTGDYIRKWVPELQNLPNEYIHEPWKAPAYILKYANVELGVSYPLPIINHDFARKRALAAYDSIKQP